MWSNGYGIDRPFELWREEALDSGGEFLRSFGEAARELGMAVGITFLERKEDGPANSLLLFDPHGDPVLHYSKVHTCDFSSERRLSRGEGFYVCSLDTAAGPVQVGAMICYDREFPESARVLMLKGAELILVPNACPMEINRLSQLRARAFENMLAVATCNYPSSVPDCNGGSSLFDGVAYLPNQPESRDCCVLLGGQNEGVLVAELDLSMLREYGRARSTATPTAARSYTGSCWRGR